MFNFYLCRIKKQSFFYADKNINYIMQIMFLYRKAIIAMKKILKKLWDGITTILVIIVFCLAILLGVPRFINIQPLVVLSGSMEPVFMTGSLVYVQEIEVSKLEAGDVITFYQDDETVVTHRIIEIVNTDEVPGGVAYRTKGDANEMEDAYLVPPENVIGEAMFGIPYLGYFAQYIQDPPGLYIAIMAGAGLILLMFLPDLFAKEEAKEEPKQKSKKKKIRQKAKKDNDEIEYIFIDLDEMD